MLLSPSILAADLADLKTAASQCAEGGADLIHFDVMDGHFVPNLTIGIPVLEALRNHTDLPLDVHLMVSNPERLLDHYLAAGASWLSFHWEAANHHDRLLARVREAGAKAGLAINPATPVEVLSDVLPQLDFVMLMSVNPGFAGQAFLPYVIDKARRLGSMIRERRLEVTMAMDGGIDHGNVHQVVASGVELCVAGSAVFAAADPVERMVEIRKRAEVSAV